MEVTCERCSTEYDFDDTLVSERGTTVKCTNCGHQFKVRRTDGILPEKWLVRTVDGRDLEFRMLRELQTAIAKAQITRDDVLFRGSSRPRRLGSIEELETFFRGLGGVLGAGTALGLGTSPAPDRPRSPTPQGLGDPGVRGPAYGAEAIPDSVSESDTVVMMSRPSLIDAAPFSRSPSAPPPPPTSDPAISEPVMSPIGREPIVPPGPPLPGIVVSPGEAPPLPAGYSAQAGEVDDPAEPPPAAPAPPPVVVVSEPPSSDAEREAPGDAPTRREVAIGIPRRMTAPSVVMTPSPTDVRGSIILSDDAYGDPRFSSLAPSRRAGVGRWVIGSVVAGVALLAVVMIGPRYLKPSAPAPAHTSDERVATLLGEGQRSLQDGDLETARDKLVKASALAEDDPRVAVDLARIDIVSADLRWLRVRLLAAGDPETDILKHDLEAAVGRARKAVEQAQKVAPNDAVVTRARVDLLRLGGDVEGARKLVGSIAASSSQPENALTLAALDVAEAQPSWPVAIERLRAAAGGEQSLGRARALLIYALVRSGDVTGAKAEHERLAAMSRPHPLTGALRAFIDRGGEAAARPAGSAERPSAGAPTVAAAAPPPPTRPTGGTKPPRGSTGDDRVPDDFVVPNQGVDTSDLPGAAPPPTHTTSAAPAPAPAPTSTTPPPVDTSDLPGINK
jgi:predicted Zn finger-like uncharacterized protein